MSIVKTTCPYCGVGCGVTVDTEQLGKPDFKVAGDKEHPANFGVLCSKGSALGDTIGQEGRLLTPSVDGDEAHWDTAIGTIANKFSQAIKEHGPNSVALYVSGQLLTEDYYVANKLMKGFVGSANIDTNSRLCMSSAVAGHKRAFGGDIVPASYNDLAIADMVVMVGANTAWCHPIAFQRIQQRRDEKKLVVIDPRRTPTAEQADLHLPIKPGTDVALFNGLLSWLVKYNAIDTDYIAHHTENFGETLTATDITSAQVADICDVDIELIERFYQWFAETQKTVTLFSMGVNQSSSGTDKVNSIINCHLATGRVGKPGASPFSMTGQPNAMGGREVGGLANMLAAHMNFSDAECDRVQRFWHSPTIATEPGLKAVDLFEAMDRGKIKAIWIMATNPAVSLPNANLVNRALEKCDFVAVSDCIANTDTSRYADVLLPVTGWGEKDGTVTNSERRISRQRAFMPASGAAKPDWQAICDVAQAMGFAGFNYQNASEIFAEHAALSGFENHAEAQPRAFNISALSDVAKEDYDALSPKQWPLKNSADLAQGGTANVLGNGSFFTPSRRAHFLPVKFIPPKNPPSKEFPLVLNSGRLRDHWHTMTRTGRSPRLSAHIVEPLLSLHPRDADKYGVSEHGLVQLKSQWGELTVRAALSQGQRRGEVFMPIHWSDQFASSGVVGTLVNPEVDPLSGEPEFKHTPVSLTPVATQTHLFLLSRTAVDISDCDYWVKVTGQAFTRYEASCSAAIPAALLDQFATYDVLHLDDATTNISRYAWLRDGQLIAVLYAAASPVDIPRDWLGSLFAEELLDAESRKTILLGESPDPDADVGPIVCSCFGVGKNTICRAIDNDSLDSVEAVGACTKAGTNCGSCRTEIATLVALGAKAKETAAAS